MIMVYFLIGILFDGKIIENWILYILLFLINDFFIWKFYIDLLILCVLRFLFIIWKFIFE